MFIRSAYVSCYSARTGIHLGENTRRQLCHSRLISAFALPPLAQQRSSAVPSLVSTPYCLLPSLPSPSLRSRAPHSSRRPLRRHRDRHWSSRALRLLAQAPRPWSEPVVTTVGAAQVVGPLEVGGVWLRNPLRQAAPAGHGGWKGVESRRGSLKRDCC